MNDSYTPGKGKIIKEEEVRNEAIKAAKEAEVYDTNMAIDPDYSIGSTTLSSNWIEETKKAMEIMNDDTTPLPGGFKPEDTVAENTVTEEVRQETLKEFETIENDVLKIHNPDSNLAERKVMRNDICNQKEGQYCQTFSAMIGKSIVDHTCAYIEYFGNDRCWIMTVLRSPEFANIKQLDISSVDELSKARFSIPFKTIKCRLKFCPECGGDLRF